jgi:hypothetical protein
VSKVVIVVRGGVVTYVASDDTTLKVHIFDFDNIDDTLELAEEMERDLRAASTGCYRL